MRHVSGYIPPVKLKSHGPQEKYSDPTGSQRMSWGVLGVAIISPLGNPSSGKGGIWSCLMSLLISIITILMLPMIAPCIIDEPILSQHAMPVQQEYIKLHPTTENITYS